MYFDAVASEDFYNIAAGGDGGDINGVLSPEQKRAIYARAVNTRLSNIMRGENHCFSILTENQVHEIIHLLLVKEYDDVIAKKYGVAQNTISDIRHHRTWKHLTQGIDFPQIKKRVSLRNKEVMQYSIDGRFLGKYASAREAEKFTGISHKQISACCNDSKHTAHGFIFLFDEEQLSDRLNTIERKRKYMRYG